MKKKRLLQLLLVISTFCSFVVAGPPLPLHTLDGTSGIHLTPTAYLANPPEDDQTFGKPSVSAAFSIIGDKDLESFGITENLWGRFEIGYGFQRLGLGDWPSEVRDATGGLHTLNNIKLHTLNLRYMAVTEGQDGMEWMPAITVGGHFKWNEDRTQLNRQLGGLLDTFGSDHSDGFEFTLMASKTITDLLPNPMIISAGVRNTDAIQTGLFGFAGERRCVFEGSLVYFLTEKLAFAAEYKQKPDLMGNINAGGSELVKTENDWMSIFLAYVFNEHMTLSGGYSNFGNVGEEQVKCGWSMQLKYEF